MAGMIAYNYEIKSVPFVDSSPEKCICHRGHRTVHCTGCGFMIRGRLARKCSSHPTIIYLMDYLNCPVCEMPIEFMQEYKTVADKEREDLTSSRAAAKASLGDFVKMNAKANLGDFVTHTPVASTKSRFRLKFPKF